MSLRYPDAPRRRRTDRSADAVATGLGWFSVVLGTAQFLAPNALARWLGATDGGGLMRAYAVRQIATGIGILESDDPRPWVWGRIFGDALDLATLGRGLRRDNPQCPQVGLAIAVIAGAALIGLQCARRLDEAEGGSYVAPDYSDRSGFPRPSSEMRGIVRR